MKNIYLDYAAATPIDPAVAKAMQPYLSDQFYNPSATYLAAKAVAKDIQAARASVAKILGARPNEIIFTAGGTEANNLAISGIMSQYPKANLVISAVEHESVLEAAHQHAYKTLTVDKAGVVQVAKLASLIDEHTVLVSIMLANNEIGTIQPLNEISKTIQTIKEQRREKGNELPLYLHTDACQAANYLSLLVHQKGIDLMTLNGGKIYGPKQSGVLFCRTGVSLLPQIRGGGQERGLRSGTENTAQIIGFAKALKIAQDLRPQESKRLSQLQAYAMEQLNKTMPKIIINGGNQRLPNNLHITIPGHDNERMMMVLDEAGIMCAVGSACSASNEEPSHVLKAIGLSDSEAQASLRFTLGRFTTKEQIDQLISSLKQFA